MKPGVFIVSLLVIILSGCRESFTDKVKKTAVEDTAHQVSDSNYHPEGKTIGERFAVPDGFRRITLDDRSFGYYLRNLPLKPLESKVTYYDGSNKPKGTVYEAVVDLPIGKRDLHQCADAVMRLRAEYLFSLKKYDSIHFNFTNGFRADYSKWQKGQRISVKGNRVKWIHSAQPSNSYADFWKYLEMVFSYAGTASLEEELKSISLQELQTGDVFIQGGFPGHAVIVVDVAWEDTTREKVFLLAQSYMPAQEIQVLKNPNNSGLSPWYRISEIHQELRTPEWVFKNTDLKRF